MRVSKRKNDQLRPIIIETNFLKHAEGSCIIKFGNTHVACSASIDESVPSFLRGKNHGWVTAEYGMLPRSTHQRIKREAAQGKQAGRTQEIQRLIGRSLRAIVDLKALGEKQILVDCDVINADGGTRCAAITGSYLALHLAVQNLMSRRILKTNPIISQVAAISCGVSNGEVIVDLDYEEDSAADVDANFVFTASGNIIEVQGTAEKNPFSEEQFIDMMRMARSAVSELFALQNKTLLDLTISKR